MNPLFAGIQANDSKDLALFLLEELHKELNNVNQIKKESFNIINQYNYDEVLKSFCTYFSNNFRSKISNIFYGIFNSMMQCLNCNITTNNIQIFNILIFPLEEVRKNFNRIQNMVTLYECFEYYQKGEYMMGQNQIHCNNCNLMSNSRNMTKLIISPNVLIINLNRGKGLQFNIKLLFEEYLDIRKYVFSDKSPTFYQLIGIVTHFGPSSMSGHFIAFCRSFINQKWYKYNDAQVSLSSFEEARTTGVPYILFFSILRG